MCTGMVSDGVTSGSPVQDMEMWQFHLRAFMAQALVTEDAEVRRLSHK